MTDELRAMLEERVKQLDKPLALPKRKKDKKNKASINTQPIAIEKIQEEQEVVVVEKEWDVTKDQEINYFDSNLSYELTGYRPITSIKGLDFDLKEFTKPALNYLLYGKYTNFVPKTLAYNKYWQEEVRRCREGYTVGKYTLTGYNYFYLNYYRIQSAVSLPGQELRDYTFPSFINKQYEYFHYIEMCKKIGKDCLAFKGRGIGASEIAAAIAACEYTVHKASRSVVTACAQSLVEKTLNKIWLSLDFLDSCTENAFRHQRMKIDTALFKRASTLTSEGIELGWRSEIEGITADQPRKLRGDRCNLLFFEEAGTNKNLVDTYIESEALVNIGGQRIGTKLVFGTSDSSGPTLAGLKKMFYNPTEYNILPYKNIYMRDGKIDFTGYFIPSFSVFYGGNQGDDFYNRGVVNEIVAKEYYRKMIDSMKDPHDALRTRAEYCFTPEDGFILEGENRFNQEALVNQMALLEKTSDIPRPKRCRLFWLIKDGELNRDTEPQLEYTTTGKILIAEMPIKDEETHEPIKNLYVMGCLTPGEKVMTPDGLKKCEDVTLDDKLFSITGKEVNIINLLLYYKENEDIYKIKLNNIFSTTTFTGEHPIYCATPKKHYRSAKVAQRLNLPYSYYTYDFDFKLMKDVKVGDFVKVPNIYKREKPIPYDKWDESEVRIDRRVGNHLDNPDFWWLIGVLLGDGWAKSDGYGLGVVFNKEELEYKNKFESIVNILFNRSLTKQKDRNNCIEYGFSCQYLNRFFVSNFGKGARNKHLPEWVKYLPSNLKYNLVMGYLASDGCVSPKSNSLNFVSSSLKLLEDIQDILFSLNIISTVRWLRSTKKTLIIDNHPYESVVNEAWTLGVHGDMINKFKRMCPFNDLKLRKWKYKEFSNHATPRCFFEDESCQYIYIKIASIELSKYTGIVYNYHCETSTFMCHYIPTHNCDSIDSDNSTSTGLADVSLFCVVVFKRNYGILPPKIVALYKDRPRDIKEAYDNALKLCRFYNCQMCLEATRVGIVSYFRQYHKEHYFMKRPQATYVGSLRRVNKRQIGFPATPDIINHALELIEFYINDYCEQILFKEVLDEAIRYSYENKRKFDIIAAWGAAMLGNEELQLTSKISVHNINNKKLQDIGWYTNSSGERVFGILNKNKYEGLEQYSWIK